MSTRLILAIISTFLEEAAIVVIVLFGLPRLGIQLPVPLLIAVMVAWGTYSVFVYRMGSRALRKKPVVSLPHMVGSKGKVTSALTPDGLVRIKGELWIAKSESGEVEPGEEIVVMRQEGLKLVVRSKNHATELESTNRRSSG